MKNIYDLKLFEEIFEDREQYGNSGLSVRRVPGGWIFTDFEDSHEENNTVQSRLSSVFVPYDEEFHPRHKPKPIL